MVRVLIIRGKDVDSPVQARWTDFNRYHDAYVYMLDQAGQALWMGFRELLPKYLCTGCGVATFEWMEFHLVDAETGKDLDIA